MNIVRRTLHTQVKEAIQEIIHEDFTFMKKLPSEQDLSERIGVSRNTIREAIKALENEGYVTSRHGVGTFVIQDKDNIKYNLSSFDSATKILIEHGYQPGTKNRHAELKKAPSYVRQFLQQEDDQVFYIERIRTANGESVIYIEDYLPVFENIEKTFKSFHEESLVGFLRSYGHQIAFVNCKIRAIMSDARLQEKLSLSKPQALLVLQQTHFSQRGIPVLYSDGYYLSDKFEFSIVRNVSE